MSQRPPFADRDAILAFAKQFPFFNLIGLEIVDIRPGWSKTQIRWRHDLCQPAGIMHGGILATLIDTGIAHAILQTDLYQQLANEGKTLVSVDLRIKYLRPVSSGMVICESEVPRLGKQIIHAESVVTNEEGKEVAYGDAIYTTVELKRT